MAQGYKVLEVDNFKSVRSPEYNYTFDKRTGLFLRWGKTPGDDPALSPLGPEIADIEISTGDCSGGCSWCYKSNGDGFGEHMTLDAFKSVMDELPNTITQVALGITDADANPYFVDILKECREREVVPNYTTSGFGLTDEIRHATAEYCGAVAVSVYPHNWNVAWDTVQSFIELGMGQVNVHLLFHNKNEHFVRTVLAKAEGVDGLNAVVLLGLKPKGGAEGWAPMDQETFSSIVSSSRVRLGFDSCSSPKFEAWAKANGRQDQLVFAERCESSLFSIYVNVQGDAYPCSFAEGHPDVKHTPLAGAWHSEEFANFRERLLANNRECPLYNV